LSPTGDNTPQHTVDGAWQTQMMPQVHWTFSPKDSKVCNKHMLKTIVELGYAY